MAATIPTYSPTGHVVMGDEEEGWGEAQLPTGQVVMGDEE